MQVAQNKSLVWKVSMIFSFPFDSSGSFFVHNVFVVVAFEAASIWKCLLLLFIIVFFPSRWRIEFLVYLSWLQSVAHLFPSFKTSNKNSLTKCTAATTKKRKKRKKESLHQQGFYDYRFIKTKTFYFSLFFSFCFCGFFLYVVNVRFLCLKQTIRQRLTERIPKLFWHTTTT